MATPELARVRDADEQLALAVVVIFKGAGAVYSTGLARGGGGVPM